MAQTLDDIGSIKPLYSYTIQGIWMGANDFDELSVYRWSNGEHVNTSSWYTGEPNDDSERCTSLVSWYGYLLCDANCGDDPWISQHVLCYVLMRP